MASVIPADLPEARQYFSAGDGLYELSRIWNAGYLTQDAYDELEAEIDWNGSILTPAMAYLYDMNADDGLMALEAAEVAQVFALAERAAFNEGLSCSPVKPTRQIGDYNLRAA